jgi:4-amino-4-deoxy-L-arabinose transferase-like glycosyltransferase
MTIPRHILLLLTVLVVFIAFDDLGIRKLAHPDEGRYSEISREMAASGDWVTPRLNGLKYFEKPPMQYWATAISFKLFGESEFSARLWTALCCLFCILIVAGTGWRLFSAEIGALSALGLIGSPYFMMLGEIVTLDMGLTFFTTLAVCSFMLSQRAGASQTESRNFLLLAWAGMAGAVLSKGLIGIVFPAVVLFLYCLTQRDWRLLPRLQWGWGLALFFAIVTPWFVAVSMQNPEFAHFFFIHEHFERFLTTVHRREQPWWFFIPILFLGVLPWAFMLIAAARHGWRSESGLAGFRPLRFALIWVVFVLVFFSLSGSKLPAYLLPVFPPLALIIGKFLHETPAPRLAWYIAPGALAGLIGAYASWIAPEGTTDVLMRRLYDDFSLWLIAASLIFFASTCVAFISFRMKHRWFGVVAIAVGALLVIEVVEQGYEKLSPLQSGYSTAQKMLPHIRPNTRIYIVEMYDQTLPFYLKRPITLVHYYDEFSLGIDSEPAKAITKTEDFDAEWMRQGDALAIMRRDNYEKFLQRGLPMEIIHEDPRRLVAKKP